MYIELIVFIVSLVLLVKGSDIFVKASSSIAKSLGVSEFIIGLTLIAIGTSMPELVSAIFASFKHESGLVMGNIVGANIANIGLILGVASIIAVIKTKKHMLEMDGYFLLFVSFFLFLFTFNGKISRLEGAVFLVLYVAYLVFVIESKQKYKGRYHFKEFIPYFYRFQYLKAIKKKVIFIFTGSNSFFKKKSNPQCYGKITELSKKGLIKDLIKLVLGGLVLIVGANYLIDQAIFFANLFNLSKTIVGIIMAIGTTMPELTVAISASRRGFGNIIMGNVIGSCITNTLLILGIAAMIFPVNVTMISMWYTVPYMFILIVLLLIFLKSGWKIKKWEGIIFLTLYLLFLALILFELIV